MALYRFAKRYGFYRRRFPVDPSLHGPFVSDFVADPGGKVMLRYFSRHDIEVSSPPDWFVNPWKGTYCTNTNCHWSELPDFMEDIGDIKTVWEASRFDWLPRMAWNYRGGDKASLGRLELWLRDWSARNPVNGGINWKCGQEAAFRCLNLLLTAVIVEGCFTSPKSGLLIFLEKHLQRIVSTTGYAKAQQNNHAISEAAALFTVGSYLLLYGNNNQKKIAKRCVNKGRRNLEILIHSLLLTDGSFSQYSVVYHRLLLDILSFTELFRRKLDVDTFSQSFYQQAEAAVHWLERIIDNETGDAPNIGANDGTYLFNILEMEYRDFRPSLQLGAAVFTRRSLGKTIVNHPLLEIFLLEISSYPQEPVAQESSIMQDGGYACLKHEHGFSLLRLPIYRFRPSHADGLQLDIWEKGVNWIRDAGTYSYNTDSESFRYYPGTQGHSTICFDGRDQMPRFGRFLFGCWLRPDRIIWNPDAGVMRCGYVDFLGAKHVREVRRTKYGWIVIDEFFGFAREAIVRWHLAPAIWQLQERKVFCDQLSIMVETENSCSLSLTSLPESRYYLEQHSVPVLEVKCLTKGIVTTILRFTE